MSPDPSNVFSDEESELGFEEIEIKITAPEDFPPKIPL
jgi:hypothetical protein